MPRTVPLSSVTDLDALERLLDVAAERVTLIFDADNTLVPQGAAGDSFQQAVTAAVRQFEARPDVVRVIVVTNGTSRGVQEIVSRGNKPWTARSRLGLPDDPGAIWVVGDRLATDGVLAWRLGARFVLLAIDGRSSAVPGPVTRLVRSLFFDEDERR